MPSIGKMTDAQCGGGLRPGEPEKAKDDFTLYGGDACS